ncbi:hypothetical protein F4780DRAFT_780468 [Xylariomycetidae sp. FL0641]|nr:hypothetical protein F4780DRAFT_780468 [Xylariomycetidae sp. FL0641]
MNDYLPANAPGHGYDGYLNTTINDPAFYDQVTDVQKTDSISPPTRDLQCHDSSSLRMSLEAFSPSVNVGQAGTVPETTGKARDACTIRKFLTRCTRNLESGTAILSSAKTIAQALVAWCE